MIRRRNVPPDSIVVTVISSAPAICQPPATSARKRAGSNGPTGFDLRGELYRISGTDLTQIDCINIMNAQTIIAEVGVDMNRFPSEAHFASFPGLVSGQSDYRRQGAPPGNPARREPCRHCATHGCKQFVAQQNLSGSQVPQVASTSGCTQSHLPQWRTCWRDSFIAYSS